MKTKVLVTGGAGYIGSHTVVELQEKGYDVVIADNLSNSEISVLDGIEKITGIKPDFELMDVCDEEKLDQLFNRYPGIEAVVHFAAFKAVGESVEDPLKYYANNLIGLINVLKQMKKHAIPYLIFSSSCTVYGNPEILPVSESSPVQLATSPYGNTKQISEEIIIDSIKAKAISGAVALRYFNPIGAHQSSHIGELPLGVPNNLVPFITQTAIGLREELKVFGNDYNTADGSCVRDYINVVDLAKAHVAALDMLFVKSAKSPFTVFNIGTGKGVSVIEIIETFEQVTGQKLNYKIANRRSGDVESVWADTKLAEAELGWTAAVSLEETLQSAWNWEQNYHHSNRPSINIREKSDISIP